MDGIQSLVGILDTHRGRDKVIRTLQYAATLCSASLPARYGDVSEAGSLVGKLAVFSKALGETRTILRLLDDLPAWFRLLRGNKTSSVLDQAIDTAENLSFLVYYPTEHIAWAADKNLITLRSSNLWLTTSILWTFTLSLGIIRAVLQVLRTTVQLNSQSTSNGGVPDAGAKRRKQYLLKQRYLAIVTIVQCSADLVNAVNRLPSGFLWAGRVTPFANGLFGTIASVLGLYRLLVS